MQRKTLALILAVFMLMLSPVFSHASQVLAASAIETAQAEATAIPTSVSGEEWSFFTDSTVGKVILTVLVAMVPVIELRGAIPIGIGLGLDYYTAIIFSLIGNILPVPFIILFFRRFFEWLAEKSKIFGRIWKALRDRTMRKAEIVDKYGFWGLCILVAIPLPGTGAWTGAMVACVLDIQMKKSFPAIAAGVVIAAVIVSALSWIGFDVIAA